MQAKAQLSRLIQIACNGDEMVMARVREPVVRLVPVGQDAQEHFKRPPVPGASDKPLSVNQTDAGRAARLPTRAVCLAPGFTDERIELYLARDLAPGQAAPEPHQFLERHELPLNEVLATIDDGRIVDAKTIAALHHFNRRRTQP